HKGSAKVNAYFQLVNDLRYGFIFARYQPNGFNSGAIYNRQQRIGINAVHDRQQPALLSKIPEFANQLDGYKQRIIFDRLVILIFVEHPAAHAHLFFDGFRYHFAQLIRFSDAGAGFDAVGPVHKTQLLLKQSLQFRFIQPVANEFLQQLAYLIGPYLQPVGFVQIGILPLNNKATAALTPDKPFISQDMISLAHGMETGFQLLAQLASRWQHFSHLKLLGGNHQSDAVGDMFGGSFQPER